MVNGNIIYAGGDKTNQKVGGGRTAPDDTSGAVGPGYKFGSAIGGGRWARAFCSVDYIFFY